jgi:hypothetical protein
MKGRIALIIFLFSQISTNNKANQHLTRFEKAYKTCNEGQCKERPFDENCILSCISEKCYSEIYSNYLLEYGEINAELKNKFEKCFTK